MASIHQSNLQSNLNLYSSIDLSDSALSNRTDTSTAATSTTQSHSSASLLLDDNSGHFLDCNGRVINLRGINIGGASKQPSKPDGLLPQSRNTFLNHRQVSFVGRPFPLHEAPSHLDRLRSWGYTFVRFLLTWESISHNGPRPDQIDGDYLDYLEELMRLFNQFGFKVVVCAHQDCWSRLSGGSGAPGWTLEAAGLNPAAFQDTGAAYVHELEEGAPSEEREARRLRLEKEGLLDPREKSGAFVWPSNYQKLAAGTMATLFWAGNTFAWKLRCKRIKPSSTSTTSINDNDQEIEEVSIQEYLQGSYIEAFGIVADRIGRIESVVGFEVMNEPHRGYCNLHSFNSWKYETDLHIGHYPNLIQSLALGEGHLQKVPFYIKTFPFPTKISHQAVIDPKGKSAWFSEQEGKGLELDRRDQDASDLPIEPGGLGGCIWKAHGVWEWDREKNAPVVLQSDYFNKDPRPQDIKDRDGSVGEDGKVEWYRDFYAPFVKRFEERIRQKNPSLILFFEPIPNEFPPPWPSSSTISSLSDSEIDELKQASETQGYASKTFIKTPRPERSVFAPHFYDLDVLFKKGYTGWSVNVQGLSRGMFIFNAIYFGTKGLFSNYSHQLSNLRSYSNLSLGTIPTIIGEVGIPFDLNDQTSYYPSTSSSISKVSSTIRNLTPGKYQRQSQLIHALISAMENAGLGFTWWNYMHDHRTESGDGWNKEDFSVISNDPLAVDSNLKKREDPWKGGRCLDVLVRPYASKIAGIPLSTKWNPKTLHFKFRFANRTRSQVANLSSIDGVQVGGEKSRVTEIFLPKYHYEGKMIGVQVSDGQWELNEESQSLYVLHENLTPGFKHWVEIVVKDAEKESWFENLSIGDITRLLMVLGVLIGALVVMDGLIRGAK